MTAHPSAEWIVRQLTRRLGAVGIAIGRSRLGQVGKIDTVLVGYLRLGHIDGVVAQHWEGEHAPYPLGAARNRRTTLNGYLG